MWRTEPTRVENLGDELWLGSNSVIAGVDRSERLIKSFRASLMVKSIGGRALIGLGPTPGTEPSQTTNGYTYTWESDYEG